MKPDLHKRHYFINQYINNLSTLYRRSNKRKIYRKSIHIKKPEKNWNGNIAKKFEPLALLGQDPVRYKIVVDNTSLQMQRILNTSVVKYSIKIIKIFIRN